MPTNKINAQRLFSEWRSACRSLWNEIYMNIILENEGSFDLEENFCDVEKLLFDSIVLYQINDETTESDRIDSHMSVAPRVLERFRITPRGQSMPVMINREMTSGYWDYPINELSRDDAEIGFVHCFDFCGTDAPRRYEYLRGRILKCSKHPEIVGKDILIPADLAWMENIKEPDGPIDSNIGS